MIVTPEIAAEIADKLLNHVKQLYKIVIDAFGLLITPTDSRYSFHSITELSNLAQAIRASVYISTSKGQVYARVF